MGNRKRSLWNDTFIIEFTIVDKKIFNSPDVSVVTQEYQGSLKSAIKFAFKEFPTATADFYTSDGEWLKEICW